MKKTWIVLLVLVIAAAAGATMYIRSSPALASNELITATVTRGDVVETVQTTGTLEAVTTVQVGTQVSGSIKALHADFNSQVREGQVVAEIEPSLFEAQVEQAKATMVRLEADRERSKVQVDDAQLKLARAKELSARKLIPASELETAESTARQMQAALQSADAQIVQARASLNQNQVNLNHTIIKAPIDGIVVSRNVDVGQTVAASMQAPVIFVIARDMTQMQVSASIDESDIGRIHTGQSVSFRVDAYPDDRFRGTVKQVRLQPVTTQNVVSYTTIISVPNDELKLKPGMTANVTVEIARAPDVLRVANGALRFRPTTEVFASLGQQPPPGLDGEGRGGRRGGGAPGQATAASGAPAAPPATAATPAAAASTAGNAASAASTAPPAAGAPAAVASPAANSAQAAGGNRGPGGDGGGARGFADMTPEQRQAMRERMQNMSPEERAQMRGGGQGGEAGAGGFRRGAQGAEAGGGRRGGQGGDAGAGSGGGAGGFGGRFAQMSPEERQQMRGRFGGAGGGAGARGNGAQGGGSNRARGGAAAGGGDAPRPVMRQVWRLKDGKIERLAIAATISDGAMTAAVSGPLQEGDSVVTGVAQPQAARGGGATAANPLMPQFGRGGPGGGRGGQGGGGGRGR